MEWGLKEFFKCDIIPNTAKILGLLKKDMTTRSRVKSCLFIILLNYAFRHPESSPIKLISQISLAYNSQLATATQIIKRVFGLSCGTHQ